MYSIIHPFPEIPDLFLVEFFGGAEALASNLRPKKNATIRSV